MKHETLSHAKFTEIIDYMLACQRRMEVLEAKYSPDQPRVPRGNPDGGEWTEGAGGGDSATAPHIPSRVKPVYADKLPQNTRRSSSQRIKDAVVHLVTHTKPRPDKNPQCAKYVREAANAGGFPVGIPPTRKGEQYAWAKDYGPEFTKPSVGFNPVLRSKQPAIPPSKSSLRKGDVAIIESTSTSKEGHIAMYTGETWFSDHPQREFWPGNIYRIEKPGYIIYRAPDD